MRSLKCLLLLAAVGVAGCGSTAVNFNANMRTTTANSNPPAANTSPAMPPPTMMPSNTVGSNGMRPANGKMPPPGMANEKMTPATHPPGYLGPPIKKPSP